MKYLFLIVLFLIPVLLKADEKAAKNAFEAVSRSESWIRQFKIYDLDISIENRALQGDTIVTETRISKELCDLTKKRFACSACTGTWWLNPAKGDSSDRTKTRYAIFDGERAFSWTKGYGITNVICDGDCAQACRQLDHVTIPLRFAPPLPEEYSYNQLQDISRRLINDSERVTQVPESMKILGENRSVQTVKLVIGGPHSDTGVVYAVGIKFFIADSGDDIGMVLGMTWNSLASPKSGRLPKTFSDDEILSRERSVFTKWRAIEVGGKEFSIPEKPIQTFYSMEDGKEIASISRTTTWKFHSTEEVVVPTAEEQIIKIGDELESRVNRMLRR